MIRVMKAVRFVDTFEPIVYIGDETFQIETEADKIRSFLDTNTNAEFYVPYGMETLGCSTDRKTVEQFIFKAHE